MKVLLAGLLAVVLALPLAAQTTASLRGLVLDQSGASLPGARVTLQNELTGFVVVQVADPEGRFAIAGVPLRSYELRVTADGFAAHRQTLRFDTAATQDLRITLGVEGANTATVVSASDSLALVTPEDTGTRAQLNAAEIERLAHSTGNRGIEAIVATFPGFAQNANGAIHPRGAHTQLSFLIDGMPITDQLAGAFANTIDPNMIANLEIFTGNIPAEFGAKTAAVVNVNTISGLGAGRALRGSTALEAARFSTLGQVTTFSGERGKWGYSGLVNSRKSQRYLDSVSLENLHNGGHATRGFFRADFQATDRDIVRFNVLFGNSPFQLANLRSQHTNGMQQRQELQDFATALHWVRTIDAATTWEMNYSWRTADSRLLPSAGDTPVTASQERRLSTATLQHRFSAVRGRHNLRSGLDLQRVPLRESFTFGITSPAFNDPAAENYLPTLLPFDLSRGGSLFRFAERATGGFYSGHLQDSLRIGNLQVSLGLRWDTYRFLVDESAWQPRIGVAYHITKTGTVLRASYNRLLQTPQNENLLLSSAESAGVLVDPEIRASSGGVVRIRPERQNLFEVGVQQGLGRHWSWNTSFYHKNARNQQDVNNFFNTPILFPLQLAAIRVNSVESRLRMTPWHGVSGSVSVTHGKAVSTPPFTGGLFLGNGNVTLLNEGPFVIDHDQALSVHGILNYQHRRGWYSTYSVRHDSGLVAGGEDPAVVAQDPDYFDLLPYVDLVGDPPRARPRTISDIVVGYSHWRQDRKRWDVNVQVTNLSNRTAVFNFQSAFVGTRIVSPRAWGLRFRLFF
ncbi:MAG: carboxypeptidase regulatory-like domain-containing protein [Bryobacter sp.]|nr:carboxypeptidase regulatory-like domain-containing protein [Bryobacter sp.]